MAQRFCPVCGVELCLIELNAGVFVLVEPEPQNVMVKVREQINREPHQAGYTTKPDPEPVFEKRQVYVTHIHKVE